MKKMKSVIENQPTIDPETLPIVQELRAELERVKAERNKAVKFIKYLDCNYSNYMSEDEKFSEWKG